MVIYTSVKSYEKSTNSRLYLFIDYIHKGKTIHSKYCENYCSIRGIQLKKAIIVVAPKKYIDLKKIMFRNNEQFLHYVHS